jgi:hypothetical protein
MSITATKEPERARFLCKFFGFVGVLSISEQAYGGRKSANNLVRCLSDMRHGWHAVAGGFEPATAVDLLLARSVYHWRRGRDKDRG